MYAFAKLFGSITDSTIWREPDPVRILWITMLAMADRRGRVFASVPGLADRARITLDACLDGLEKFRQPDPWSRTKTPECEGRRIQDIDGGWLIINYEKYRQRLDEDSVLESKRRWWREHRSKEALEKLDDASHKQKQKQKQKQEEKDMSPKRAPRASGDAHFDRFWAAYPKKENKPGALKAWKKVKPDPDAVIAGVEAWRKSERWAKGYIVAPAKFLTERRWEDAPQPVHQGSTEVAL